MTRAALLLALPLLLTGCGGGDDGGTPARGGGTVAAEGPADAQTATVAANAKLAFSPSTVTARPGTLRLTMRIDGGVPHNLVPQDSAVGAPLDTLSEGSATTTWTLSRPGTYSFVCTLHPGMAGQVVVAAP